MKDTQFQVAAFELDDALGFPVEGAMDQAPSWSVDDQDLVNLTPSADGLSCQIAASGKKLGHGTVSLAVLSGGKSFTGTIGVDVVAGDAATIKISLGDAQDQAPAAPQA